MSYKELKYYLYSQSQEYFIPVVVKNRKVIKSDSPVSIKEISDKIKNVDIEKIIVNRERRIFWENASEPIKFSFLISYYLATEKNEFVAVETEDWSENDFLFISWLTRKSQRRVKNIIRPRQWYFSMISTVCMHVGGIRFENIHLAFDKIDGRGVYTAHWDKFFPGNSIKSLFMHNLKEVYRVKL